MGGWVGGLMGARPPHPTPHALHHTALATPARVTPPSLSLAPPPHHHHALMQQ